MTVKLVFVSQRRLLEDNNALRREIQILRLKMEDCHMHHRDYMEEIARILVKKVTEIQQVTREIDALKAVIPLLADDPVTEPMRPAKQPKEDVVFTLALP